MPRTCIWRQLNLVHLSVLKNMKFSSLAERAPLRRLHVTVYDRIRASNKDRLYVFYKITLARESALVLPVAAIRVSARGRSRMEDPIPASCIDRDTYRGHRIDIAKIFPKRGTSIWRARELRSENIFDHFVLVCQHFTPSTNPPARSMDVSIIRNVNFRRRNIIHML